VHRALFEELALLAKFLITVFCRDGLGPWLMPLRGVGLSRNVSEVQNAESRFEFCSPGLLGYNFAELAHLFGIDPRPTSTWFQNSEGSLWTLHQYGWAPGLPHVGHLRLS
jgi:hypothetical protein